MLDTDGIRTVRPVPLTKDFAETGNERRTAHGIVSQKNKKS